jgi:hypothetical protein
MGKYRLCSNGTVYLCAVVSYSSLHILISYMPLILHGKEIFAERDLYTVPQILLDL